MQDSTLKPFYIILTAAVSLHAQRLEEMDGAKFAKLCRDTKLLSRGFTPTDVDLFFAKVRVGTHLALPTQAFYLPRCPTKASHRGTCPTRSFYRV